MPRPALFIGVVSHEGSRYAVSQGPHGLAHRIADALPGAVVQVNTANLLETDSPLITDSAVQESLSAESRAEADWARFLQRPRNARFLAVRASRWGRRLGQRVRPPAPAMLRRLLNIELSHLDLMRTGLASGAPWILILEDDALSADVTDLVDGMTGLMDGPSTTGYVNLSQSFTPEELGIEHLLTPASIPWSGSAPRTILSSRLPVTNTVCAILYSSAFLAHLIAAMDRLPVEPVVPIDWKLNLALMDLHGDGLAPAGTCLLVELAPIAQMSMQPTAILPS